MLFDYFRSAFSTFIFMTLMAVALSVMLCVFTALYSMFAQLKMVAVLVVVGIQIYSFLY